VVSAIAEVPHPADSATADAPRLADSAAMDAPRLADSATADAPRLADSATADAPRLADSAPLADAAGTADSRVTADLASLESAPAPTSRFPDTTATIAILSDQLPNLSTQQTRFAATHYVGSQKLLLGTTHALRAINPNFVVLHYHLAMWQSAPATSFITDGLTWGNDYPEVTLHETWFWHNASGARVPSSADGKLLMNVSNAEFASYWADSIARQTAAGEYDGVFLDSASPALLQGECSNTDSRLAGTAAATQAFTELGEKTWSAAWGTWIGNLDASLAHAGVPLIPNTSAFVTTWDKSDYDRTAGIFVEGFAEPSFSLVDWKASTNQILKTASAGKIVILQSYLSSPGDVARRFYYLANYLLVKGSRSYLFYFASTPLEWYPEWQIALGAPATTPANVDALAWQGAYRRDFAGGVVLLNPSPSAVSVTLPSAMLLVAAEGGGAVPSDGSVPGSLNSTSVTTLSLAANTGAVLLKQ
jgi:hypothetical protein